MDLQAKLLQVGRETDHIHFHVCVVPFQLAQCLNEQSMIIVMKKKRKFERGIHLRTCAFWFIDARLRKLWVSEGHPTCRLTYCKPQSRKSLNSRFFLICVSSRGHANITRKRTLSFHIPQKSGFPVR